MNDKEYDSITFTDGELSLDVSVDPDEDTVWLTREQIALLFDRDRSVISRHINNIFKEQEVDRDTSVHFLHISGEHNHRPPEYYNLDVIISVGYRVKSSRGILFRKWSSWILKQYLIKGYAMDEKRLSAYEKTMVELTGKVLSLDARMLKNENRVNALEEVANRGELPPECAFFAGQCLDARTFFAGMFSKAEREIVVVDSYADNKLLSLLSNAKSGLAITLIKGLQSRLSQDDIDAFIAEHGPIKIKESDDYHDRFVFVDDACYHVGASFNHMGKRAFAVMRMEDETTISQLKGRIDSL